VIDWRAEPCGLASRDSDKPAMHSDTDDQTPETIIPLAAEEIAVSKQAVETGRVQIARVTHEREQLIDEMLAHETAEISRVRVGQQVEALPAIREEDGVIIIPIVEEVLIVERRLFLKEEVRIRRVRTMERHQESVTLRYQEAVVTREPVEKPDEGTTLQSGASVQESNQEG
jgi:uncharacterized protein (TIGR02271 family)